ncbi:MAG: hypothetical protein FWD31_01515 [Planctomycetaceae bacterium]|nr:hypothetical protein [Planctomycetaceae bacterium]
MIIVQSVSVVIVSEKLLESDVRERFRFLGKPLGKVGFSVSSPTGFSAETKRSVLRPNNTSRLENRMTDEELADLTKSFVEFYIETPFQLFQLRQ